MTADAPSPDAPLRIGTRGSPLALAQAYETRARLMAAHGLPQEAFEVVVIKTTGDRVQDRPLSEIGGKGLFTKEIEEQLLSGAIDLAVHSTKDMPTVQPDGLALSCFLPREDVRDAFVTLDGSRLAELPRGAVVGTSSLRRRAQLLNKRPDLEVVEFRGNVQTRMRKLADGVAQATFLAVAGLHRLGLEDVTYTPISPDEMLPAIGQGAIGIEQQSADMRVTDLLAPIHDHETATRLRAERAFLKMLDGSCQTPIGGLAELKGNRLSFRGEILSPDGRVSHDIALVGGADDAERIGIEAAQDLLARAGPDFLKEQNK